MNLPPRVAKDFLFSDCADVLLANSEFTANVFESFFSISRRPRVVYPGINLNAYEALVDREDKDVKNIISYVSRSLKPASSLTPFRDRPTLISLNRFEKKKNALLAVEAFALLKNTECRLIIAGGFDSFVL